MTDNTSPQGPADTDNSRQTYRRASAQLLEMLVCPLTHATLKYDIETQELISERARLAYPIRDGIPIMLVEEARILDD
ncbi:Trm112 family protein [Anderseniella sp. Alg231-50]|uniref:Trm112 family protein n=1 Tax=Anderseniella sp. Alg231-50 TaxID=1922226 RepID=UPI000D558790